MTTVGQILGLLLLAAFCTGWLVIALRRDRRHGGGSDPARHGLGPEAEQLHRAQMAGRSLR